MGRCPPFSHESLSLRDKPEEPSLAPGGIHSLPRIRLSNFEVLAIRELLGMLVLLNLED